MSKVIQEVFNLLKKKRNTVGFAESCTGGLLSSLLTEIPGSSKVFWGSVVAYDNSVKSSVLKVKAPTLKKFGAVSPECAFEMAQGAQKVLKTDWAVSITGIAGPSGGTREKPVGLVCIGIVGPSVEVVYSVRFKGSRRKIQQQAANYAASLLKAELLGL